MLVCAAAWVVLAPLGEVRGQRLPDLSEAATVSALDGVRQPIRYWAPPVASQQPTPLFVFLHSWSSDYRQANAKWLEQAVRRDWIYLHPNFRGVNQSPKACGSRFARQDILDAVEWICGEVQVDRERIYVAGVSGGGHMTMLMAAHHPDRFSAASAWVGISDLAAWHRLHTSGPEPSRYARMIEQSLGGPPGTSPDIDAQYRDRSAVFHLHQATDLPLSIWAGVNDGHSGSVPVSHALRAFNAVASGRGTEPITESEIQELLTDRRLSRPRSGDEFHDADLDRDVLLRRRTGPSLVTIFDGGHESLPDAACNWLARQRRRAEVGP